jgi:hypothetical protein
MACFYRGLRRTVIPIPPPSDERRVKFLAFFVLSAALASAQSHPSWWTYASPEATALVGIQWDNLRNSPFAPAIEAELSSTGPLAFPDLECLNNARQIVISSPALLAAEAGSFPASAVKQQAQRAGLNHFVYRGVTLWVPTSGDKLGVAQISEQIVLVAARKTLESAIDRNLLETGRPYSGLLQHAARFAQTGDLWVVALRIPDPLANLFVPLDAEGVEFEGQVSLRNGLSVAASFDAPSTDAAAAVVEHLKEQVQTLPAFARNLDATSDRRTVNIELQATAEEVEAALRPSHAAAPATVAAVPAPKPQRPPTASTQMSAAAQSTPAAPAAAPLSPPPSSVAPKPAETQPVQTKPEPPPQPQIIRIVGLDDGPKEIVLPPVPSGAHP